MSKTTTVAATEKKVAKTIAMLKEELTAKNIKHPAKATKDVYEKLLADATKEKAAKPVKTSSYEGEY